jgi:hypothetical protein
MKSYQQGRYIIVECLDVLVYLCSKTVSYISLSFMEISTLVFTAGKQHLGVLRQFMKRVASGCNWPFISV